MATYETIHVPAITYNKSYTLHIQIYTLHINPYTLHMNPRHNVPTSCALHNDTRGKNLPIPTGQPFREPTKLISRIDQISLSKLTRKTSHFSTCELTRFLKFFFQIVMSNFYIINMWEYVSLQWLQWVVLTRHFCARKSPSARWSKIAHSAQWNEKTEVSSSTFKRYQFDQIFLLKILYSSKLFIYIDKARNLTFLIRINALKEYA